MALHAAPLDPSATSVQPAEGRGTYWLNWLFGQEEIGLPQGARMGNVSASASTADGTVYVFQRGSLADPPLAFDESGRYMRTVATWDGGLISVPHGLRSTPDGMLWIVDCGTHQVHMLTPDGKVVLSLGRRDQVGCSAELFNMPTDVAVDGAGNIYVADGYGNNRVAKFDPTGRFLLDWSGTGEPGGELDTPHSLAVTPDGRVHVSDRGNDRVQIFDSEGRFEQTWDHVGAANCITISGPDVWIVSNYMRRSRVYAGDTLVPNLGHFGMDARAQLVRLSDGAILGALEAAPGGAAHWIDVLATGRVYVSCLSGNVFAWTPGVPEPGS